MILPQPSKESWHKSFKVSMEFTSIKTTFWSQQGMKLNTIRFSFKFSSDLTKTTSGWTRRNLWSEWINSIFLVTSSRNRAWPPEYSRPVGSPRAHRCHPSTVVLRGLQLLLRVHWGFRYTGRIPSKSHEGWSSFRVDRAMWSINQDPQAENRLWYMPRNLWSRLWSYHCRYWRIRRRNWSCTVTSPRWKRTPNSLCISYTHGTKAQIFPSRERSSSVRLGSWALPQVHFLTGMGLTDHQALTSALSKREGKDRASRRIGRWYDRFTMYTYSVKHRPGEQNRPPDMLSSSQWRPAKWLSKTTMTPRSCWEKSPWTTMSHKKVWFKKLSVIKTSRKSNNSWIRNGHQRETKSTKICEPIATSGQVWRPRTVWWSEMETESWFHLHSGGNWLVVDTKDIQE